MLDAGLRDKLERERARLNGQPEPEPEEGGPFARNLDEFVSDKQHAPVPLLGTEDDCVIPALGLALLIAKGGKGKTTFCIELCLHWASGVDYLGITVERPLKVLFIENEGPREPFRRKFERKLRHWGHDLQGGVFIHDQNWGHARLDLPEFVSRLNAFCERHDVDIVVGDPLDSLGMAGEGTPSETRAMVDRFKAGGLFSRRAWLLPHHSRKESVTDAVDEAAGAWGGRPDAMLVLEKRKDDQARLSFAKVRWQARERNPHILDFDPETETFTFVKEEEGEERDYLAEVEELLEAKPFRTTREIANAIAAGREKVQEIVEAHPNRFDYLTGDAAKAAGRHPNSKVWCVASASGLGSRPDEPDTDFQGGLG